MFENLVNLHSLRISSSRGVFPDFHWLSNQTRLETLSLSGEFHSLEGMQLFSELTDLSLHSWMDRTSFNCLQPISGLTNLRILSLTGKSQLSDISPLDELVNLQRLSITDSVISDISVIANFTLLQSLDIGRN
ncbi:MAG: hypothetical protein FWB93_02725 [Oscillospiraceae bacterium]|nr:hypothetical protein [Oscillospiraceae bacterium]